MKIELPYENCRKQFPRETKQAEQNLRSSRSQSNKVQVTEVAWSVVLRERVQDRYLGGRGSRVLEGNLTARHKGWFTEVPLLEIPQTIQERWEQRAKG